MRSPKLFMMATFDLANLIGKSNFKTYIKITSVNILFTNILSFESSVFILRQIQKQMY